ncbi:hypothetical protein [Emticicia sp. 17c]|uniref:hypothetical protein n=1 Tax=Emticicia sp. 17c TaxID=3127704 RepID=UPI00301D59B6
MEAKSDIDKVYEIVQDVKSGKLKLPEVSVGLADATIYKIVFGISLLFGIMTAAVFFLVKAQRR